MDFMSSIQTTLSDPKVLGAIVSTISIIMLGFVLRKKGIFNENVGKILSKVVLTVALPCLAFTSFMKDLKQEDLKLGINVLIWGFVIYILLIFVSKIFFVKFKKQDEKTTLEVLTIFGSTTFFGTPIVSAVFGATGVIFSNVFNIAYRVFLYSYGYIKMSGLKMKAKNIKTMFLNPIIIATFVGLLIWIFQDSLPQVAVAQADGAVKNFGFLRLDQTVSWLYKPLTYLSALASPLAWLSIGATLGEVSFKEAASSKTAWYYSVVKVVLVPLINIVLLFVLNTTGILTIDTVALSTIVIMMAAPTATVAAAYAISFDKEAVLASNASLISTVFAVIMTPIWIVVLQLIANIW